MRPIFNAADNSNAARKRPPITRNINPNPTNPIRPSVSKPVVKSRLFAPKAVEQRLKAEKLNTNGPNRNALVSQKNMPKKLLAGISSKVEPVPPKPPTLAERMTSVEEAFKAAISLAESQLLAIGAELQFTGEELDEAARYCDQTVQDSELYNFYHEKIDLAQKLQTKDTALTNCKMEHLKLMHDYLRFLDKNFAPFKDIMDTRRKKIEERIASEKAAKEAEQEKIRQNPELYKQNVEMKEQGVQVRPESLIYYSPTAGVLRSTIKQRVVMPASPVLKTDLTPTSSFYGSWSRAAPIFQKFSNAIPATAATSYCDDSVISAKPIMLAMNRQMEHSPFPKRLNFDETIQDVENIATALSKTTVNESMIISSSTAITSNETLIRSSITKLDDAEFARPSLFIRKQQYLNFSLFKKELTQGIIRNV